MFLNVLILLMLLVVACCAAFTSDAKTESHDVADPLHPRCFTL